LISEAGSSQYTLIVMTAGAVLLVPVIMLYQWWGFRTLMSRLGRSDPPLAPRGGIASHRDNQ
jgi:cytochrome bd-type quinol oxidase subunit 2